MKNRLCHDIYESSLDFSRSIENRFYLFLPVNVAAALAPAVGSGKPYETSGCTSHALPSVTSGSSMSEAERACAFLKEEAEAAPHWPFAQFSDILERYPTVICEKHVSDLAQEHAHLVLQLLVKGVGVIDTSERTSLTMKAFLQRHPAAMYFFLVLFISYGSFLIVVGPRLLHGGTEQASDAESILFPIMDLGVLLTALVLTSILDGGKGLRHIFSRLGRWRANVLWYAVALLVPPALILIVLTIFRTVISPVFTPNFFALGIVFGIPALLEEIGWTGYAYPRMRARQSALVAALMLGVLWGLWHAPVVDYLGAAAPHGAYWLPFFLSFIAIVAAMRVLIVWVYAHTESLLLAWLMHLSMTASLVVLDPTAVSPAQETLWYWGYAIVLWLVVAMIALLFGKNLVRQPKGQVQTEKTATA